jgi:hypothetical protein
MDKSKRSTRSMKFLYILGIDIFECSKAGKVVGRWRIGCGIKKWIPAED